jgi:hypothetical protein
MNNETIIEPCVPPILVVGMLEKWNTGYRDG